MRLCLLLLAIFFCKITYAGDNNNFYEQRHNFLKNYIEQLKTLQKKDKNYKGSVVETISGSFFIGFGTSSQNQIDPHDIWVAFDTSQEDTPHETFQSRQTNLLS